jgi:excisionase family DNA binding protein
MPVTLTPTAKPKYVRRVRVAVPPTTKWEDLPQFLTVEQAAEYTQQCVWTIRKAVDEKRLPDLREKMGGKLIRIPREAFRVELREAEVTV